MKESKKERAIPVRLNVDPSQLRVMEEYRRVAGMSIAAQIREALDRYIVVMIPPRLKVLKDLK